MQGVMLRTAIYMLRPLFISNHFTSAILRELSWVQDIAPSLFAHFHVCFAYETWACRNRWCLFYACGELEILLRNLRCWHCYPSALWQYDFEVNITGFSWFHRFFLVSQVFLGFTDFSWFHRFFLVPQVFLGFTGFSWCLTGFSWFPTGFSWFPFVYKQMLRWFPRFQVATTCFSCSPPDLNLLVTNFMFCLLFFSSGA